MAKKKNNAFTIVELLVAMSLLVILLALSGIVFNTTVQAHRAAGATIDVTRNLRAITDQLNRDFQGLRKDAPLFVAFNFIDTDGDAVSDSHYDTIHFFADGDFQTTRQYFDGTANKTIYGNMARVYYGHANSVDRFNDPSLTPDYNTYQTLARKTHVLTADADIALVYGQIPLISNGGLIDYTQFLGSFGVAPYTTGTPPKTYTAENALEFNTITLTNWINALNYLDAGAPDNANHFITNCMADDSRPFVDLTDINTLHLLLSQGVIQMQIQWAYANEDLVFPLTGLPPDPAWFTGIRWWPSEDPDGDPTTNDSDFDVMNSGNPFGVFFEMPGGTTNTNWFTIQNCRTLGLPFRDTFYPKALKFTFVLRDSNGLFADGKTFTHIVYIDN